MKYPPQNLMALCCIGLVLSYGTATAQYVNKPLKSMTRQENGYYSSLTPAFRPPTSCSQPMPEEDVLSRFQDNLYTRLAENLSKFSDLQSTSFIGSVSFSREGKVIKVSPVNGLTDPNQYQAFNRLLSMEDSYGPFLKNLSKPEASFYIASDGLHFYQQYPDKEMRSAITYKISKGPLSPWARQVIKLAKKNWHPRYSPTSGRTEVLVYMDTTGTVLKRSIATSSCNPDLDNDALVSVDAVKKFPGQPVKYPMGVIKVLLAFDYEKKS